MAPYHILIVIISSVIPENLVVFNKKWTIRPQICTYPPHYFLPIYSHEAYTWKGYNFSMEDTRKGYPLSKMVYIRVRDWASGRSLSEQSFNKWPPTPPPPLPFSLGLSTSCSATFWQLLVFRNFRATFFVSSNFLHNFLLVFFSILRYRSNS